MFILRDLLTPPQEEFSNTSQGQKRKNMMQKNIEAEDAALTPFNLVGVDALFFYFPFTGASKISAHIVLL